MGCPKWQKSDDIICERSLITKLGWMDWKTPRQICGAVLSLKLFFSVTWKKLHHSWCEFVSQRFTENIWTVGYGNGCLKSRNSKENSALEFCNSLIRMFWYLQVIVQYISLSSWRYFLCLYISISYIFMSRSSHLPSANISHECTTWIWCNFSTSWFTTKNILSCSLLIPWVCFLFWAILWILDFVL